ncbi:MAG: SBBP repeat-containing protein [Chloroflexi bacterium]|nr:SBBP repeat-containing protein [Chloroflexota bacterium]
MLARIIRCAGIPALVIVMFLFNPQSPSFAQGGEKITPAAPAANNSKLYLPLVNQVATQPQAPLIFSTFIGGALFDQVRDVTTDAQGNIYLTGLTASSDFPTTAGAFQRTFAGGNGDVFVTKLDPTGRLVWSTLIGSSGFDYALAIKVDQQGYVYIGGLAGPGAPTTPTSFQPGFNGFYSGGYGSLNAYLAKLTPNGSGLVWASYVGSFYLVRDFDIDQNGDIYAAVIHDPAETGTPPAQWFVNAPYKTPRGDADLVVAKIKSDGTQVIWASYFGGSGNDIAGGPSIKVDATGSPYAMDLTTSTNLPVTPGVYQGTRRGGADFYLVKFNPTGTGIVFSTYLGGSGDEGGETHNLILDRAGNAFIAALTYSHDFPMTAGAFQSTWSGPYIAVIAKLSNDGKQLLASSYFGGTTGAYAEGVALDPSGNVVFFGGGGIGMTVTANAYQKTHSGNSDYILAKMTPNLTTLLYATYLGGTATDDARAGWVDSAGNMVICGQSQSSNFPVRNAFQSTRRGDWDGACAKLSP